MSEELDLSVYELIQRADEAANDGFVVFIKFTCENCGSRQTFDTPNAFFRSGQCEECGHITVIKKGGMLVVAAAGMPYDELLESLKVMAKSDLTKVKRDGEKK